MSELAASGYPERLTNALSAWERNHHRVGRGGNQSELHRQLVAAFGAAAPARATVSKWIRLHVPPEPEHGEMLARVLGVRPAWLYFNDGPMDAAAAPRATADEDERKRAFLDEQERKYGTGGPSPAAHPIKRRRRG